MAQELVGAARVAHAWRNLREVGRYAVEVSDAPAEIEGARLVTLRAGPITNGGLNGEALPRRLKLLNWGRNETVKGPVLLDERSIELFEANQRIRGLDRVALDFEHNTVPGSEAYKESAEPRPVAGYGAPRIVPGEGLFLDSIVWTPLGTESARNYHDLSPAIHMDGESRVIFVHSAALCRNGAVHDLTFFSNGSSQPETCPPCLTGAARTAWALRHLTE